MLYASPHVPTRQPEPVPSPFPELRISNTATDYGYIRIPICFANVSKNRTHAEARRRATAVESATLQEGHGGAVVYLGDRMQISTARMPPGSAQRIPASSSRRDPTPAGSPLHSTPAARHKWRVGGGRAPRRARRRGQAERAQAAGEARRKQGLRRRRRRLRRAGSRIWVGGFGM